MAALPVVRHCARRPPPPWLLTHPPHHCYSLILRCDKGFAPRWCHISVILQVHDKLIKMYPTLLLVLVPRHPCNIKNIFLKLKKQKVNFVLRSTREVLSSNTSIYMVDMLGPHIGHFYHMLAEMWQINPIS
ncbi:hypothetical protein GUJ93_ZPchr0007g4894 [Zizania palustris]|uniref:Uncharacterized protein n=1 Tax=Zizania palustris TaxID=103762 RepID=A0A8J5T3B1_ZIZPA|nr:hypothetical protein GUJ93_ZPchr0007g4894 [Zizania palustris]